MRAARTKAKIDVRRLFGPTPSLEWAQAEELSDK